MYDVKKVSVIVGGRNITGFSADAKVSAERLEDGMIEHVDVDGGVSFSKNANNSGEITINLKSTSPSVAYLNQLANRKEVTSISVIDLNSNGVNATGADAVIRQPRMPERGKEVSDVEFVVFVGDLAIN